MSIPSRLSSNGQVGVGFARLFPIAIVVIMVTRSTFAVADDEQPLHERIDRLIAEATPDYAEIAAPLASDEEFLRRVYLDLIGMPPTVAETRDFHADETSDKRTRVIDALLERPEFARHLQRRLDVALMRRLPSTNVKADQWQAFLRTAIAENKPWDQITREILSADGSDPNGRGPARFFLDRNGDVNEITRDVGRIFLGADLECAQCHDHPLVEDYKQSDYYGISAFLVRSFVFTDKEKKQAVLAEKAAGEVSFESVFEVRDKTSEGPKSTPPQIFGEFAIDEPKFETDEAAYEVKPADNVRPVPKFSRLSRLPSAIASAENRRFVRTSANRFWAMLVRRGIIDPVEMDHSDNPPSHPELLKLLADELAAHGFDIKWYLREIALSDTYQRSSRRPSDGGEELPAEETFAQAILKPLSPAQFAWSVLEATGECDVQRAALGEKLTEEALHAKLAGHESTFVKLFGGLPGKPPEDFESTMTQVLFLSNDGTIVNLIKAKEGNLAHRLMQMPADDSTAIADELFLSVLSRRPTEQDLNDVQAYLDGQSGEARQHAIEELIWSLVTSAEFRFNH